MRAPEFWHRGGLPAQLLAPASALWRFGAKLKRGLVRPWRAPVPVICVGNLVAGGAGKTPAALAVAARLVARGIAVHFLSRGYGGGTRGPHRVDVQADDAAKVGDEPLILARRAPTWVARDRARGARAACAAGARAIVMDDGHQNAAVEKTLSLVVVDGEYGFGNGRVVPAGPLREPVEDGLARAHAVILVGEDLAGARARIGPRVPVLGARIAPLAGAEKLKGARVAAFAGIGRPEKFYATLKRLGATVVATRDWPDHYRYRPEDLMGMVEHAASRNAALVTTAKDAVRLPPGGLAMVQVVGIELVFDDPAALDALLAPAVEAAKRGA